MMFKADSECLKKVADDEPIFVLRAQDVTAPTIVRVWAQVVMLHDGDGLNPKTKEAVELADRMEEWQNEHRSQVKWPD